MAEKSNMMWGGRFEATPSEIMEKINESISYDKRFAKQDIAGSMAHCRMLAKQNIITQAECDAIVGGLTAVEKEIIDGKFDFSAKLEDIHMNVEHRMTEIVGDAGGKLHTARSRNDQVAVDFKIWIREAAKHIINEIENIQKTIVKRAKQQAHTILPGFTHTQVAQPVVFAHHLMAYFEMFQRDKKRLINMMDNLNECPLGACALAGTSFNIDREWVAKELGFRCPTKNSMDSVADRDFVLEFLSVISILAIHLSRIAEELIIWSTSQFRYITLSDQYTTGSSIMPQKKNPDAAELIRGKTGRVIGALDRLMITLKGLPLTYNRDQQEDKEGTFDAYDTIVMCLVVMNAMLDTMVINEENMRKSLNGGYPTATDLADWLVINLKIPFRQAHGITGKIVKIAENKDCRLDELLLSDMQTVEPRITNDVYRILDIDSSVNSRTSYGGTAPGQVKTRIVEAEEELFSC